ncbi:hypothetical protein AT15_00350 [Kosmotoga arenicorallina S304]|uniref:ATPase n=1 Tax=Kosmotoga arenicorallina S304 TaxID=1453497 RepID=A0A176K0M1_9BACT|nr:DUF6079 family protein [Kosmotoga arenicorallina]OAA30191.1 hypothetical protein AT15_00350 [Kosmotoga arenicorallina S304]
MKYGDLIQFDPVETVAQLKDANDKNKAANFVSTYVISNQMADNLRNVVFENLQFETPRDSKGLMIVGNYGTGKSHLMAVISSITEDSSFIDLLTNDRVKESASKIAGKFKVIRTEIGTSTMYLRDIIFRELKENLEEMGIYFNYPSMNQVVNNKGILEEMMSLFNEKYPDQGLLMVVDELLDYLRHRNEKEIILDINFLREIGEFCKSSRFRFIAGVQETLFENPRFEFVSDSLRRVKDRFVELRIVREDIEYVTANRLLKKNSKQKALIREHLQKFTKFYSTLNENLDNFVELFPIHPAFITMFEKVKFVEKREVLQTISKVMRKVLDKEMPEDEPGIISFDSYWDFIKSNAANRAVPEIRETEDKSDELMVKVESNIKRPYLKNAKRIVKALSVHRLSTSDINTKLGLTVTELRDNLCIFDVNAEMGGDPLDDLHTYVETILREIIKIVSGQYVSYIKENGQYYLDLNKTIDFDAQIEKKAEVLDKGTLNRYYYDILAKLMECSDKTYVPGFKIWEYELRWYEKNTTRPGYLFFGQPNERSTAQPPRDFYIYFLPIYKIHDFKDEGRDDEVFFSLKTISEEFEKDLLNYAAAMELAKTAGMYKSSYEDKARSFQRTLTRWLNEHFLDSFEVTYQKRKKDLREALKEGSFIHKSDNFKETVDYIASMLFNNYFDDTAIGYPKFPIRITSQNRIQNIENTLKAIALGNFTKQAKDILSAFNLLDESGNLNTSKSPYIKFIRSKLQEKGVNEVLNTNELIETTKGGVEYFGPYRLEPEWVVVLLAAMVYMGEIEVSLGAGETIDASNVEKFAKIPLEQLLNFKNIKRPKGLPILELKHLFTILGINAGQVEALKNDKKPPVQNMLSKAQEKVERMAKFQYEISQGITFWSTALFDEKTLEALKKKAKALNEFFDSLQKYHTVGKLKNFKYSDEELSKIEKDLKEVYSVEELLDFIKDLNQKVGYLERAKEYVPLESDLHDKFDEAKTETLDKLKNLKKLTHQIKVEIHEKLDSLKKEYIKIYKELHRKARLNAHQDERKQKLRNDIRLKALNSLAMIKILPNAELNKFTEKLANLKTCYSLIDGDLERSPICESCGFKPTSEKIQEGDMDIALEYLDEELDKLFNNWTNILLDNLRDPVVEENMGLLHKEHRELIEEFLSEGELTKELINNPEFTKVVAEALSGLEKVEITTEQLVQKLFGDHSPLTPQEMKERFEKFVQDLLKGKDSSRIRIVLEKGGK